jgi:hypothetical protein
MNYPLIADGGPDDLPRTLRREKEAREREAREREAAERAQAQRETLSMGPAHITEPAMAGPMPPQRDETTLYAMPDKSYIPVSEPLMPATVERFDVPFLHLVTFFLKAVIAAIPALILLTAVMWVGGQIVKMFFPWLLKAQILIQFPN